MSILAPETWQPSISHAIFSYWHPGRRLLAHRFSRSRIRSGFAQKR